MPKPRAHSSKAMAPLQQGILQAALGKNWVYLTALVALRRNWPDLVGRDAAAQSEPYLIRRETLFVSVASSIWMHELQLRKTTLLEQIRALIAQPVLTDIRWLFQVSATSLPAPLKQPSPQPVQAIHPDTTTEDQEQFTELAGTINDPACRAALLKLWSRFHGR